MPVAKFGSEDQKKRAIPRLISGEDKLCIGITEPDAGLNTTSLTTKATRTNDGYVISGRKVWTTSAQRANKILIIARTTPRDQVKKATEGLPRLFYTDFDRSRITATPIPKMGRKAVESNSVFIDNLPVPAEDLVGEEGRGFYYLLEGLNPERVLFGAEAVGLGRAALKRAATYAKERIVFDRPIGQNQGVAHPLARAWMDLEAANLMAFKAAALFDAGRECGAEANAAKYLGGEAGFHACETAVFTLGGMGYAKERSTSSGYFRESMIALVWRRSAARWSLTTSPSECLVSRRAIEGVCMRCLWVGAALGVVMLASAGAAVAADSFTVADAISYPFTMGLVSAERAADRIAVGSRHAAWKGGRRQYLGRGRTEFRAQAGHTQFTADDGQELTQLTFSPDGATLVFVRGGDHHANWPATGNLQPDPTSSTSEAKITLWLVDPSGAKPAAKIIEGDAPAISSKGDLRPHLKDGAVWTAKLDGTGAKRLFFDRGKDSELVWSPDASKLAFSSMRDGDHAFIGVFSGEVQPIEWLAPSTGVDREPVWSPDGKAVAYTRQPGRGGEPLAILTRQPRPWSIWTADVASGAGRRVWKSPQGLHGSYPDVAGQANLAWAGNGKLAFLSEADNWPHPLCLVPVTGEARRKLSGRPGPSWSSTSPRAATASPSSLPPTRAKTLPTMRVVTSIACQWTPVRPLRSQVERPWNGTRRRCQLAWPSSEPMRRTRQWWT